MSETKHTFRNLADKLFHKDSAHEDSAHHTEDSTHHREDSAHHTKDSAHHTKDAAHAAHHTAHHTKDSALDKKKVSFTDNMGMHIEDSRIVQQESTVVVETSSAYQEGAPIVHTRTFAPVVETHVNPTTLDQTVRKETVVEVQPVIHRTIEEPEVHVVERHIYEKVPAKGPTTIVREAIVEEIVKPRIIEEIQPVLHRDVPAPYTKHVEEHITEHVVRPTVYTKEVIEDKKAWTAEEAVSQGFVAAYHAPAAAAPVVHTHRESAIIDTHLNATQVEQTTRPEVITEIQPIIHREIDAPEVHYIEKHMYESVPLTQPRTVTKQAIIEEEIRPKIVEEIKPIIHREVPEIIVEKREEHITEKVVAPTIQSKEVVCEERVGEAVSLVPEVALASAPLVVSTTAKPSLTSNVHSTIVEETARPEEIIEVQPIVHKKIDAPEVHVIEKHTYEEVAPVAPKCVTKQAIVEETIVPKVLEEIKPVVHREVPVAVVQNVEEHTTETLKLDAKEVYVAGEKADVDISLAEKEMSGMSLKKKQESLPRE